MKKMLLVLLLLLPITVCANETESIINSQIEQSGISELAQQLEKVKNKNFNEIVPRFDIKEMTKSLALGGWKWDISVILKRAFAFYCKELFISVKIMTSLIALAFICSLVENLQKSFGSGGPAGAAFFACFFLVTAVAVNAFISLANSAADLLDDIVFFVNALIPVTLSMLAAGGAVMSAGVFHGTLVACSNTVSLLAKNILMPFILISTALGIAGCVSEQNSVGRLAKLFSNATKWALGAALAVFVGIISLQSVAMPVVDGISVKTAKYAMGAFVPVVGSVLSETLDLVFACFTSLKNAVGVAGLVSIIAICSATLLRLAAQASMFYLTAALAEPISDKRIVDMLSVVAGAVTLIFALVLSVMILFVVNLTIIIGAGNNAALFGR
ncbi:MAG: stage III sporulation protein AE [Firmicutes bacterium]|nr:stage III sporulation protein AE [Bacillota bacterium]